MAGLWRESQNDPLTHYSYKHQSKRPNMLPDMPTLKNELAEIQREYIKYVKRMHLGSFCEAPVHFCFEGHTHSITRATGDSDIKEFESIEDNIDVRIGDDLGTVFGNLADMAIRLAHKIRENSFKTLDEDLTALGRVADGSGKPRHEQFLEMISNIQIPLNAEGELDLVGLRIEPPNAAGMLLSSIQELGLAKRREFNSRLNQILAEKKEEARALEANRTLVG
jgi:hypothetical protein